MESSILVKSMLLIEHLADSGQQSLGSIATAVGQTRPTTHRILGSLIGLGYVAWKEDGVYSLTTKLRRVAMGGEDSRLIASAEKAMEKLRSRTGETTNLGVLRGTAVRYLYTLQSPYPLRRNVTAGETDPFYCTALGRVLASGLPPGRVASMLEAVKVVKRSTKTETDRKKLRQLIQVAAVDGYAVEHDQTDLGVSCVAAPVWEGNQIVAAVSISGVSARFAQRSLDVVIRDVCDAASRVTKDLRQIAQQ